MSEQIKVTAKAAVVRDDAVLLVEYRCPGDSRHLSLPGGSVRAGEGVRAAAARHVQAEISAQVAVGRLLLVVEYLPNDWQGAFGDIAKLQLHFEATLLPGAEPAMPAVHDPGQHSLHWVRLDDLEAVPLRPRIAPLIRATVRSDCTTAPVCASW